MKAEVGRDQILQAFLTIVRGLDFIFRTIGSHWKVIRRKVARCDL